MYIIRYVKESDKAFWFNADMNIDEFTFDNKLRNNMAYIFEDRHLKIGILRYPLFSDHIPFCNLLCISEKYRHKGCGRALIQYWEQDMKACGYLLAMASSYIDDEIHGFYRKMGYREVGGILIPDAHNGNKMEIIMVKQL